jgi:hypothetical protein
MRKRRLSPYVLGFLDSKRLSSASGPTPLPPDQIRRLLIEEIDHHFQGTRSAGFVLELAAQLRWDAEMTTSSGDLLQRVLLALSYLKPNERPYGFTIDRILKAVLSALRT